MKDVFCLEELGSGSLKELTKVKNPTVLTARLERCHHHWHFVTIAVISLLVGCASEEND